MSGQSPTPRSSTLPDRIKAKVHLRVVKVDPIVKADPVVKVDNPKRQAGGPDHHVLPIVDLGLKSHWQTDMASGRQTRGCRSSSA